MLEEIGMGMFQNWRNDVVIVICGLSRSTKRSSKICTTKFTVQSLSLLKLATHIPVELITHTYLTGVHKLVVCILNK